MHNIHTTDLPGIGQKFVFHKDNDDIVTIIIYHTGQREIYHTPKGTTTPHLLLELKDEEARAVSNILSGAYLPSVPTATETHSA